MTNFLVEIYENDLVWLAYAAGIAQGSGNSAGAESLFGILSRMQPVEQAGKPDHYYEEMKNTTAYDPQTEAPSLHIVEEPTQAPPQGNPKDFGAGPGPAI